MSYFMQVFVTHGNDLSTHEKLYSQRDESLDSLVLEYNSFAKDYREVFVDEHLYIVIHEIKTGKVVYEDMTNQNILKRDKRA